LAFQRISRRSSSFSFCSGKSFSSFLLPGALVPLAVSWLFLISSAAFSWASPGPVIKKIIVSSASSGASPARIQKWCFLRESFFFMSARGLGPWGSGNGASRTEG
jgi:hypothetical protein